jgi:S1-C subfamily serine protease
MSTSSSTPPSSTLQALSDDLAAAVSTASSSIVAIHARRRIPSSGVIWRPGVVVTAHHTIQREDNIKVTLADGTTVGATLAGRDPSTDIAVLRLNSEVGLVAKRPDAGEEIRVGQLVLALGMPGNAVTAAMGVVSAMGGEWRTWSGGRIDRFVRLDLAIYDGFSGGPLVDARGRVLGINSSGLSRSAAMTIPASTIDRVAEQLLTSGHVRRGFVGVGVQPVRLTKGTVQEHSLGRDVGLMVISVDEGGPAHSAGVSLGDVIVVFDGRAVSDPAELLGVLTGDQVGKQATLRILRGGAPKDVVVTIGERGARGSKE